METRQSRLTQTFRVWCTRWDGSADLVKVTASEAEAAAWAHKLNEGRAAAPYWWERRG